MKSIRQAVIFAGGRGTRLRPLTYTTPKPMIIINGKPFLQYLIELLVSNGITQIVVLVGYLHKQIETFFGDGKNFGVSIIYSYAGLNADTGTRLKFARLLLDDKFLLLYGDNLWPLKLDRLLKFYNDSRKYAVVTVYDNRDGVTRNNMLIQNGLVYAYDKNRTMRGLNGVDIGFFIIDKRVIKKLPKKNFSFERIIIPRLINSHQLAGYMTNHKYYGLTSPDRISVLSKYLRPRKTLILDRDGVINVRPKNATYISDWKGFVFLPRVKEALVELSHKGYEIYIASNQAGIARGVNTKDQIDRIHSQLVSELKKYGVSIADIVVCPHGWDDGCFCRKPSPGLLFNLSYKHSFDLYKSVYVGDDVRDIIAGSNAGCKTIYISKKTYKDDAVILPDIVCDDLYNAAIQL